MVYSKNSSQNCITCQIIHDSFPYTVDFNLNFLNEKLEYLVENCIHNYLVFENGKLMINYPKEYLKKSLVYKGFKKINKKNHFIAIYKILTSKSSEIEIFVLNSFENCSNFKFYSENEIFDILQIQELNDYNAYLLFLLIKLKNKEIL